MAKTKEEYEIELRGRKQDYGALLFEQKTGKKSHMDGLKIGISVWLNAFPI